MTAPLRRIEADLQAMITESKESGDPIDLHELWVIARQISAQAEQQEGEL